MQIPRLRFAPSPTGMLHIGGVRTALFNWLFAKHHKGQFLLRIEDTDLERSEARFTQDILASMRWLGLGWDEEPIYQSRRLDLYRAKADALVASGHAYRCVCTEADVEAMRGEAMAAGKKPQYDRRCREKNQNPPPGIAHVIRAKVPLEGYVEFQDLIRGSIRFENADLDDFVLIRTNGAPTYNLSVVVDDVESRITHVVRGDDHINNTPKQLHLYRALGFPLPLFAHLPMILGPDKKKLSKRHGAVSANVYRAEGYLPETLLNFLARLGWSHGDDEVFTVERMIELFDFDHVQRASGVFNSEKLLWLNGVHLRAATPARLSAILLEDFGQYFPDAARGRVATSIGLKLVSLIQPKIKLVKEIAEQLSPLCEPGVLHVDPTGLKWEKDPASKPVVVAAVRHGRDLLTKRFLDSRKSTISREGPDSAWGSSPSLADLGFAPTDVEATLRQVCDQHGVKLGDLAQPIRLAVTGRLVSAGLFEILVTLPWETVEARLRAIEAL